MLRQFVAIDYRRCGNHYVFKVKKDSVFAEFAWNRKMPAIKPDLLPSGGIPVLPGKFGHAMRQRDLRKAFVTGLFPKQPVAVQVQDTRCRAAAWSSRNLA